MISHIPRWNNHKGMEIDCRGATRPHLWPLPATDDITVVSPTTESPSMTVAELAAYRRTRWQADPAAEETEAEQFEYDRQE